MANFTRQHYQSIADAIRGSREPIILNSNERVVKRRTKLYIVGELCRLFHNDNPQFDEAKFIKACGLDKEMDELPVEDN